MMVVLVKIRVTRDLCTESENIDKGIRVTVVPYANCQW
jgi:hypothetical protein